MLEELKEPLGQLALAADIDPFASEGKVRADARTKWLVYIWESLALPETVFTICLTCEHRAVGFRDKRSLQDPHFSCFGYWKNAVQDGFDDFNLKKTWQIILKALLGQLFAVRVVRRVVRGVVRRVVRGVVRSSVVRGARSVGSPRIGGQSFLLSRSVTAP